MKTTPINTSNRSARTSLFTKKYFKGISIWIFMWILVFTRFETSAQTIIIDSTSATGGSFENVINTFPANGWSKVNSPTNKWFVGALSNCNGSKGAYIGTAAGNNNYTITTAAVSHFYRSVTFPAGETCINLSFNWKANGEVGFDGVKVYVGSVGGPVPVANTTFITTDAAAMQMGASFYDVQAACGRVSITFPAALAGSTRNLVFSWENDNSGGGGMGATVDNIGLISAVPAAPTCAGGYAPANLAVNITNCNPILTWTAPVGSVCSAPSMYYVYFGTAAIPPLMDSTTALTYTLGSLSTTTAYHWKIVPKNALGLAAGCAASMFTTNASICTVSPGGVGVANLTAWFKSDALAAGNLTSWTTAYPTGGSSITVTDPSAPYSQVTNGNLAGTNSFNYNQYISFANNDTSAGNNRYLYNTSSFNLMTNSDVATDQSSFFAVSRNKAGGVNDAIAFWLPSSGNYGLQCRGIARMAIGSGIGLSTMSSRDPAVVTPDASVFSYTGNRSSATSMTAYYNGAPAATGIASESQGGTGLAFGIHIATNTPTFIEPFQGDETENIFLNTTLASALIVNRVHTYLAVKYGITLSTNYVASNNATIFTTTTPYNNNIIGIGRDDASGLTQKQSHNTDDSVRVYTGTLAATNVANAAAFATDQSFVMTGATTGQLNATPASNAAKPAGIYSRLERQWQITKTNYGQTFSIDIALSPLGSPLSVIVADLRLLVDNSGNFATAAVYAAGGGLTFSYTYPVITVSGISNAQIPNNSSMNITIGSVSVTTPLPVELTSFTANCNNKNIVLNWVAASETGSNYYTIERAADGADFIAIEKMNAKESSSHPVNYSYTDNNLEEGTYYYRLKRTDASGSYQYSAIVITKNDCGNGGDGNNGINNLTVYPNPVKDQSVQIKYTSAKDETVTVKLINMLGQTCLNQSIPLRAGENNKAIAVDNLRSGIYVMRIESSQQKSKVVKLIINRNF